MTYQARLFILAILLSSLLLPLAPGRVSAGEPVEKVQIITDDIVPHGHGKFYLIKGLKARDRLYVNVHTVSGNLDPLAALAEDSTDILQLNLAYDDIIRQALDQGKDPISVIPQFAQDRFLVWDDDSGTGYDAAFAFTAPADGDYKLLVYPNPTHDNWGTYQLTVGINVPEAMNGQATATGDAFVSPITVFPPLQAVESVTGTLSASQRQIFHLRPLKAGDRLDVYVETTADGSIPALQLQDFGNKVLATSTVDAANDRIGHLYYVFKQDATNYVLILQALDPSANETPLRLLAGINSPEVASGQARPTPEQSVFQTPIQVAIGVKMDQITGVDQKAENFSVVNTLRMEWQDPKLAFDPASCHCNYQSLSLTDFKKYVTNHGTIWPEFVYFNQQARRDIQNNLIVVFSDGRAIYYERSTVTLQAPDFDFRLYPFDIQKFFIRIRQVFPSHLFVFTELPDFTGAGAQLGEEEWVILDQSTAIETVEDESEFVYGFTANRHLIYYVVRIFVPVLLIIIVSWFAFFLKDYSKRVDIASANLLVFVAFNFTISDALPHLGYPTVLDMVLVTTFVITGLVVVFNVWLKRLEVNQKESIAQTIDAYSIWLYPLLYFAAFAAVAILFSISIH